MKIGIDMRSVQESSIHRGIGKYVVTLLRSLAELDTRNQYYLFLYDNQSEFARSALPHNERWNFIIIRPSTFRTRKFIRTFLIGKESLSIDRYDLDVVLQLDKFFPIAATQTPIVSVVHDLIPQMFRSEYQHVFLRFYSLAGIIIYLKEHFLYRMINQAMRSHRDSDAVIAISAHTASDLQRYAAIAPEKITIVPHGAETIPVGTKPLRPAKLPGGAPFIFYVGGVDPRKCLPALVDQFATIAPQHSALLLVIAGKEGTNPKVPEAVALRKQIQKLGFVNRVLLTGYAHDSELAYLYQHAVAFVLASRYEGFGMPVLEAFQAGCPVVVYNNSSIPEVAGDAALLVPDGESLMPQVERLMSDQKLRRSLITKGQARAKDFTWERTARETLGVLLRVGGEG